MKPSFHCKLAGRRAKNPASSFYKVFQNGILPTKELRILPVPSTKSFKTVYYPRKFDPKSPTNPAYLISKKSCKPPPEFGSKNAASPFHLVSQNSANTHVNSFLKMLESLLVLEGF
ncbi:hypothetical protein QE152_g29323 [Popillia japonica]|uniref:Uncharacterized protein n=1 Tax=Popillia japonica TaxID=7064 RepID=A0AAW1JHZ7_POPJA